VKRKCLPFLTLVFLLGGASALGAMEPVQKELDAMKQGFLAKAPSEKVSDFERGIDEVADSGVLQQALGTGDKVPDFSLPSAQGGEVSLSELLKKGPVVLVWYRGGWCPYCMVHLKAMQEALGGIRAAGGEVVAISPEIPEKAAETREKNGFEFPIVSDTGNRIARQFRVVYDLPDYVAAHFQESHMLSEYNGDDSETLPLAVAYVIDSSGTIRYAYLDADYRRRAEPEVLLSEVRKLKGL